MPSKGPPLAVARIEPELKAEVESILKQFGMTPSQAIRQLYERIAATRGLPWGPIVNNAQAASAVASVAVRAAVEPVAEPWNGEFEIPTSPMPSQSLRR